MLVVTYTCVCPYLDIQGSRDKIPHGHFFMTLSWSHFHLGDKPLQNRERFRHLSYFTFARSAHVVTMAVTNPIRIELMLAVLETAVIPLHQRLRRNHDERSWLMIKSSNLKTKCRRAFRTSSYIVAHCFTSCNSFFKVILLRTS